MYRIAQSVSSVQNGDASLECGCARSEGHAHAYPFLCCVWLALIVPVCELSQKLLTLQLFVHGTPRDFGLGFGSSARVWAATLVFFVAAGVSSTGDKDL